MDPILPLDLAEENLKNAFIAYKDSRDGHQQMLHRVSARGGCMMVAAEEWKPALDDFQIKTMRLRHAERVYLDALYEAKSKWDWL